MLRQYAAGEFLDFAERDGLETARPLKAKAKAAYAAKQVENAQLGHSPASCMADSSLSRVVSLASWLTVPKP